MDGVIVKSVLASVAVFCMMIFSREAVATDCQDPTVGWREDCQSSDSACAGGYRARYHTHEFTNEYLESLRDEIDTGTVRHMTIIDLGDDSAWSFGFDTDDPTREEHFTTYLVRVAGDALAPEITKPPILIVGSFHASEWVAAEVALGYLDYLIQGANGLLTDAENDNVVELLEKAEFWFVAQGNVGGREYGDVVDPDCDDTPCEPGNIFDNLHDSQQKNMQWVFTSRDEAGDDSLSAARSGYCDFNTTGVVKEGTSSNYVDKWDHWGIDIEDNFSAVWPGGGATHYDRVAMLTQLVGSTPRTDYSVVPLTAPEMFDCGGEGDEGDTLCESMFPSFPDPVFGFPRGGHTHCLQRGGTLIAPIFGCFMASSFSTLPSCEEYVATNNVADELGILHVCLRTQVSPETYRYLLWECNTASKTQNPTSSGTLVPDNSSGGPLLSYCGENGVRYSCRNDADCTTIPDSDFHPQSVHHSGQRYCADRLLCAVGHYRTPCSTKYRGKRPFEAVEARLLRTIGDNVPFSFMVDMHATANNLSVSCKGVGGECEIGNAGYQHVESLRAQMIEAYNVGVTSHWGESIPDFLKMVAGTIDPPAGAGSQFPVWMSAMPETSSAYGDTGVTSENFDNGTYRGVTSFLWELGIAQDDTYDEVASTEADRLLAEQLVDCSTNTSNSKPMGCVPQSSLFLENQLAGMKEMMGYLAGNAVTPNMSPPENAAPNFKHLSLGGLRIHDGHGRGIQQLETRPDRIKDDGPATTVIPAGTWAVEVDAIGVSAVKGQTLNGEVTFTQKTRNGGAVIPAWSPTASEVLHLVDIDSATRTKKTQRFRFDVGTTNKIGAEVSGMDACNPDIDPFCAAANNRLVAKVKAVSCYDTDAIPNGLTPDEFCSAGLPFADPVFKCSRTTGRCRECWAEASTQQDCDEGEICYEGMCDDPDTCWNAEIVDEYESNGGTSESSPTIISGGTPIGRTLHLGDGSRQDVDSFLAGPTTFEDGWSSPTTLYFLLVSVRDVCEGAPIDESLPGLEVRVQGSWYGGAYTLFTDLTEPEGDGWVTISRDDGLKVVVPTGIAASLNDNHPLRIQVRNTRPDDASPYMSISYTLSIVLSTKNVVSHDFPEPLYPWDKWVWPMENVPVDVNPGEVVSFVPADEGLDDGYSMFFKPAVGYEDAVLKDAMRFVLVTRNGVAPTNDNGLPLALTSHRDGGLAIPLGALNPKLGPYQVRLQSDVRVEGSVYLCSPNVDSCATFDPRTATCGSACTGDGVQCCADQDRNYYCANLKGSDVLNCGACGNACDWDEKCLKGVCVTGKATSCWNTTCPENTECVSKDFLFLRNPQCKATMVDRTWCGWFGTVCSSTQNCVLGLCLPKMNVACGLKCVGEGQSCCWVNGVEQCVDVASSWARCGSCGNTCGTGELCEGGKCEPWYTVANVCPGEGGLNCSRTGILCVNALTDPDNCGACGEECPDSSWCEDGRCMIEGDFEATNEH